MRDIPRGYAVTAAFTAEAAGAGLDSQALFNRYMERGWSLEKMVMAGLLVRAMPESEPLASITTAASSVQVGGNHYKQFPIQPAEFSERNKLSFLEASVVKRVCRHSRGGKGVQDIDKAIHELQLIKEFYYAGGATPAVPDTHAASEAEDTSRTVSLKIPLCDTCGLPAAIGDHNHPRSS